MTQSNVAAKAGLEGVSVADSAVCHIDGEKGELRYRGYLITDLAAHSDFVETTSLLWLGELPNKQQRDALSQDLASKRSLPETVLQVLRQLAGQAQPMEAIRTAMSALSVDDLPGSDVDPQVNLQRAVRITARIPTIVAAYDRLRNGQEPLAPRQDLSHAANFLYMLTGEVPTAAVERMLDVCLVLHAEHGFNASTFAGRVTAATLSDMYSAVTSAVGALKGPLHGGANTEVMKDLLAIGSVDQVEAYLDGQLAQGKKVMGFGHRVYKVMDPRAVILREFSEQMAKATGEAKWFEMSVRLADLMKTRKDIDVNVDFFSASTYYSMGIQPDLFTAIFAISRVSGWLAHIMEQHANNRLIRPRSTYVGSEPRDYVFLDKRP